MAVGLGVAACSGVEQGYTRKSDHMREWGHEGGRLPDRVG